MDACGIGRSIGRNLLPWRSRRLLCLLAGACLTGCVIDMTGMHDDRKGSRADGALCETDTQCRSGMCTNARLCGHSFCDCPGDGCAAEGEPSTDCTRGWSCVYYESLAEKVGEVFLIDHDQQGGYCEAPCAGGCPEHYTCSGTFCSPDQYWPYPIPSATWSGAAQGTLVGRDQTTELEVQHGKLVVLSASATSPVDVAIPTFQWTLANYDQNQAPTGQSIEFSLEPSSSRRAELSVTDAEQRTSLLSVIFKACNGTGDACGYEGSGCCNGCAPDRKLCN